MIKFTSLTLDVSPGGSWHWYINSKGLRTTGGVPLPSEGEAHTFNKLVKDFEEAYNKAFKPRELNSSSEV